MRLLWSLLAGSLMPLCAHAEVTLIPPPFAIELVPNTISGKPNAMNSAFGPRDPGQTIGSRFHEGIDLAPNGLGQIITSTTTGKITGIKRGAGGAVNDGGHKLYVQDAGTGNEFGYLHLFKDAPYGEDVILSGMMLGQYQYIASQVPFVDITCTVIYDASAKRVLMDQGCPPRDGAVVFSWVPSPGFYTVVKSVAPGMRMAPKGNSGARDAHLHLNYLTAQGLKNPLFRIQHDTPAYTAQFIAAPRDTTPLSNPTFTSADLPKGAWVKVDFSTGYDLDEVDFTIEGAGGFSESGGHYRLGGRPGSGGGPLPANVRDIVYVGADVPSGPKQAIYAAPAGIGNKKLAFWMKLPVVLATGPYRLKVQAKSVHGALPPIYLPFTSSGEFCDFSFAPTYQGEDRVTCFYSADRSRVKRRETRVYNDLVNIEFFEDSVANIIVASLELSGFFRDIPARGFSIVLSRSYSMGKLLAEGFYRDNVDSYVYMTRYSYYPSGALREKRFTDCDYDPGHVLARGVSLVVTSYPQDGSSPITTHGVPAPSQCEDYLAVYAVVPFFRWQDSEILKQSEYFKYILR